MPSSFPGMNPYLEQDDAWHDVHERFRPAVAEELGAQLVPTSIVKIDEHVSVHGAPEEPRHFAGRADLTVGPGKGFAEARAGVGVLEAPALIDLPEVETERLAFVEIRDRRNRELITIIELLSPSNKRAGPDRDQYLAKRGRLQAGTVHDVEIDLLRGGQPMPAEHRPPCADSVTVSRAERRPKAEFWPIGLREPLPTIPVPVRAPDPDARLDLQRILHRIYDAAGYQYDIDDGHPDPPLSPEDAAWAASLIPPPPADAEPNPNAPPDRP
ncbi:DUF4058 family protein [Tautonia sociabilis]|uniref:DUF4058 family protein n=1 Tax=Tautonia sociabilis TaxID=2080755 RepID=A0A432ML11_9BACT|nr:DUF4058 family protein [Tautonia sociabilis]RUL87897.1 DUF4058 family protein [Tautonia sociabilis]